MREIKFRGKMVNAEKWLYGNLQVPCKEGVPYYMKDEELYQRKVDVKTIGQYTGLKDKNGKEIYEGDILRVEVFKNESGQMERPDEFYEVFSLDDMKGEKKGEYVTPVCWEDGAFVISTRQENDTFLCVLYGDMRMNFPIFIFEVIGNIYDNPELINKEYLV